jgi:ketosteroid isomerase-like protein
MNSRPLLPAALALAFASAACQPPAQEAAGLSEEDVAAIQAWHGKYMEAERATDWNALAALVADDVVLMPPNRPVEDWASWLEVVTAREFEVIDLSSTVQEIDGRDGLAYLRASYSETYTLGGNPEPLETIGKHVAMLRKQPDGSWVATVWIWNSDLPLPEGGAES